MVRRSVDKQLVAAPNMILGNWSGGAGLTRSAVEEAALCCSTLGSLTNNCASSRPRIWRPGQAKLLSQILVYDMNKISSDEGVYMPTGLFFPCQLQGLAALLLQ